MNKKTATETECLDCSNRVEQAFMPAAWNKKMAALAAEVEGCH
jgi:hypothetical protein